MYFSGPEEGWSGSELENDQILPWTLLILAFVYLKQNNNYVNIYSIDSGIITHAAELIQVQNINNATL